MADLIAYNDFPSPTAWFQDMPKSLGFTGNRGVPGSRDTASIQTPRDLLNGSLDEVKLVEDDLEILTAGAPKQWCAKSRWIEP